MGENAWGLNNIRSPQMEAYNYQSHPCNKNTCQVTTQCRRSPI